MISREPTIERLAVARSLLLEPFGLDEAKLAQALATIATHRIDDADLYFQYTRSEGWSLEEGIVKSGSFGIDQGVGVRAVAGEKTAFAYSDDISEAALLDAARTVRTIAAAGQSRRVKVGTRSTLAGSRGGQLTSPAKRRPPRTRLAPPSSMIARSTAGLDRGKFVGASASSTLLAAKRAWRSVCQSRSASVMTPSTASPTVR